MLTAAGRLNQRVTLQSKSVTRDAMGGEVITWVDVATVWADVKPLSGKALIAAQQAMSEVTASIFIRLRTDVADDWRVVHGTKIYAISAIIDDIDKGTTNLQCSTGLRNG